MKVALVALTLLTYASAEVSKKQTQIDYNAAPPNLSTLPDGSLFTTWRPKAHVLPPSGHIGDPAGHYVDPNTGLFHVGYLYTRFTNETIRGGAAAATTSDFVTYQDINSTDPRFIKPGGINDPLAVFDGTVIASGYQGNPTFIYTAVSFFPFSWTLPYIPGCETQAIAVSNDTGRNFTKLERGPVIASAPFGLNITGWRDPFSFQDPEFDKLLNSTEDSWYIFVSGGEHDVGPVLFLYRKYDADFMEWEYLGRFWHESVNTTWGEGIWAGRWGFNFEVGNVFRVGADGIDYNGTLFSLVGTEGGKYGIQGGRAQLWAAGDLEPPTSETVTFNVTMAGVLDWGSAAYAASGKVVPASSKPSQASGAPDRYIVWLWLTGTFYDSIPFPVGPQGWDSSLLTPRELYVETIQNVVDNDAVHETGSWKVSKTQSTSGTVELVTLGIKPAREVIAAYTSQSTTVHKEADRMLNGTASNATIVPFTEAAPKSRYYVLEASLTFPHSVRNASDFHAGFHILSSEFEKTTIYYQFSNESLIVDRSNSSAVALTTQGIDSRNEAGRMRLWDIKDTNGIEIESLNLQIIVDNSIVEIYANNRFTLSTLVLPWYNASKGISFFCEGEGVVSFSNVTVHEGLVDAWPGRVQQ